MNYILIPLISLIVTLSILYYFNRQLSKLKTEYKDLTEKLKKESAIEYYKNIKVIVNNNPDKTTYDCYNGAQSCLVLNIPRKTLSIVGPGTEHILISNFKMNTIKVQPTIQELTIEFTDGSKESFTNSSKEFCFKDLMKWFNSKESNQFLFYHSDGFTTIRRDLIKHIKFNRISVH